MIRFYIKNEEIVFSLFKKQFETDEQLHIVAIHSGGYDRYIDKETDHTRWHLVNGKLQEQEQPTVG